MSSSSHWLPCSYGGNIFFMTELQHSSQERLLIGITVIKAGIIKLYLIGTRDGRASTAKNAEIKDQLFKCHGQWWSDCENSGKKKKNGRSEKK